jgi:hypothetical protein
MAKVDLKKVRDELLNKQVALKKALKEHRASLTVHDRLRYKRAIAQVGLAHGVLKHLDCDPPDMSFEFPPPPLSARYQGKLASAKKRGKSTSRKRR